MSESDLSAQLSELAEEFNVPDEDPEPKLETLVFQVILGMQVVAL